MQRHETESEDTGELGMVENDTLFTVEITQMEQHEPEG